MKDPALETMELEEKMEPMKESEEMMEPKQELVEVMEPMEKDVEAMKETIEITVILGPGGARG